MVREPDFRFSNMLVVTLVKMDTQLNFCVDSWRAADGIRPFKSKPLLD